MRESAVSIPQFASPPFVGPYERKESSNSESAVKVEIEIGVETRERGVGVRGAELEEEGCWRMSGHRVSWPEGADGHETNVIGEPSRLLPVARSALPPPPLFLPPPATIAV